MSDIFPLIIYPTLTVDWKQSQRALVHQMKLQCTSYYNLTEQTASSHLVQKNLSICLDTDENIGQSNSLSIPILGKFKWRADITPPKIYNHVGIKE